MKAIKLLLLFLFIAEMTYSENSDDLVIAKEIKLNSAVLGEERTIYVSTPSGYDNSQDSYTVLYVLDGVPEVIGLVKYLSEYGVCPRLIIVAIGQVKPARDMFPSKPMYRRGSQPAKPWYKKEVDDNLTLSPPDEKVGEADKYLSFIEKELFPFIGKNYRTVPYRICCGHSKGGLCVAHAFLTHTNMFNSYIALNPSLYWDDGLVLKTAEEKLKNLDLKHKMFYFDIGENEVPSTIGDAYTFAQIIRNNASTDLKWKLDFLANENHSSGTAIGIINALKFIFEGWDFDTNKIKTDGISAIDRFYTSQSEKYGYKISPDVGLLNSVGWGYMRDGLNEEAIKIFKENVSRFPDSPDAYNYLGEGYLAVKNIDLAIKSYEKAVEVAIALKDDNKVAFLKSRIKSIKTSIK